MRPRASAPAAAARPRRGTLGDGRIEFPQRVCEAAAYAIRHASARRGARSDSLRAVADAAIPFSQGVRHAIRGGANRRPLARPAAARSPAQAAAPRARRSRPAPTQSPPTPSSDGEARHADLRCASRRSAADSTTGHCQRAVALPYLRQPYSLLLQASTPNCIDSHVRGAYISRGICETDFRVANKYPTSQTRSPRGPTRKAKPTELSGGRRMTRGVVKYSWPSPPYWCLRRAAFAQEGRSPARCATRRTAVMPGVTVEVTSPALIEKIRSAVDGYERAVPHHQSAGRHLHGDVHARRVHETAARQRRPDAASPRR